MEDWTESNLALHLGEKFIIQLAESGQIETELIDVKALGAKSDSSQREPFSILFRGPGEPLLTQQMYKIRHEKLGELELFLVPLGPDDAGLVYEAVFN